MKKFVFGMYVVLLVLSHTVEGSEWAHNAINLTHEYGDGSGVKVGLLDGVTRCSHQELDGRCENYFPDAFTGEYYSNHGTHVATIIAGKDKAPDWVGHDGGVAPKAKIYNYAVFEGWGVTDAWWISDEVETEMANLAASHGVTVINQSYGDYNGQGQAYLNDNIVKIWRDHKDIIFVNAAGNEGTVLDPGDVKNIGNVIFVGATDQSGRIASWSNRPGNNYKDQFIVAPGDFISGGFASGDAEYGWMSGTSMAAPIVTGAIAILHDHWGHLKGNPEATAGILFESATDMGAPGVDKVYGHGMLNILGIFDPIAIVDNPGDGGEDVDECEDTVVIIIDEPGTTIGTPGDGQWFDSRGRKHISQCPIEEPEVVITNPGTTIGTPGDGRWFDSRGNRRYFAIEVNGERRVLRRMKASSVLMPSASNLSVVFFDRYGRDYKTNAANYQASRRVSEFMDLNDTMALQFVAGDNPNFKMKFDDISIGKSRTMGFENNPVLAMLDDGAFISNDKVGVMYSDTATTALYKPQDWLTLTFVKENGFLGSTGVGKYDTISSTVKKDYGIFFGSTTMAVSKGEGAGGIVKMSNTVTSLAFETGMKVAVNDRLNWQFSVSQDLQPIDGTMSVSYDNQQGRNVIRTIDMDDYRDTKFMFKINYTW